MSRPLIKGVAYHGNRMLTHAREDLREIAESGFNAVLHMFSHNDWDRHKQVMKEIFAMTEEYGMDVWVDNWGLGGPPGDKSHFLAYHPEAHQVRSDGTVDPVRVCVNHPSFVQFTKDWIDTVGEAGAKKLFWDEPHFGDILLGDGGHNWNCRCEVCQKLFEEQYDMPMPTLFTPEVQAFRKQSISRYFQTVASYAKENGLYNSICIMFMNEGSSDHGVDLQSIADTPALDNIGSDPYWNGFCGHSYEEVYQFVYERTLLNMQLCEKHGKDHNLWLQTYSHAPETEDEIIAAADAIYDAGARTIFAWGFRGSDANDYRAKAPDRCWYATKAAFERISERHRDECRRLARKQMGLG